MKATRILELKDLKRRLKTEKQRSQEVSSVIEKAKSQLQKDRDDLEATQCLVEETERALAQAREAKLLRFVEVSRAGVNVAEDQVQIASTCVLPLKEEQQRNVVPSEEKIRAEAQMLAPRQSGESEHWRTKSRRCVISNDYLCIFLLCSFFCFFIFS